MSTHLPGFQSFSGFSHHFALAKLASSSIRVKELCVCRGIVSVSSLHGDVV